MHVSHVILLYKFIKNQDLTNLYTSDEIIHPFADIDECQSKHPVCNAATTSACVNSIGDYFCICKSGFTAADDRHSCEGNYEI